MKSGDKYFVRIDKKLTEAAQDSATREAHFDYLKKLATITKMFAGGFADAPGGMIIFAAQNIEDARAKCDADPVISKGFYGYDLYDWTVQLTSNANGRS